MTDNRPYWDGLSEIFGSCAGMCEEKDGLHWAEDHILVEVLHPETNEPVEEGARGEMVLTTLRKTARPMVRFRTGDIVSFTSEPCGCGRTSIRLQGVHGRLEIKAQGRSLVSTPGAGMDCSVISTCVWGTPLEPENQFV